MGVVVVVTAFPVSEHRAERQHFQADVEEHCDQAGLRTIEPGLGASARPGSVASAIWG
jgi:hypothetical protein